MIQIARTDPRDPDATALLHQSHALMQSLFPPEDNSFLSIDELCAPGIHFFGARFEDKLVGTAALAEKTGYVEVKSMFVDEAARGKGVADSLMQQLIQEARALGAPMMLLETGNVLAAAHRLYGRHGFQKRGPFGDYSQNTTSVFMEKAL